MRHVWRSREEMYRAIELSLADTKRALSYKLSGTHGSDFSLKGFDIPWLLTSRLWSAGEAVLDVGAGYSDLPSYLATTYGCEVWAVDDFGQSESDPFWSRGRKPMDQVRAHPEVRYVLERLGTGHPTPLPTSHFDCIYSISALEHVPPLAFESVWRQMDGLLKPGGEMLHAIDVAFPTSRGLPHVLLALAYDWLYPLFPRRQRMRFLFETAHSIVRNVSAAIPVSRRLDTKGLNVVRMVLDPEVLVEPVDHTFNRITKDGKAGARHFRVTSLLLHLVKLEGDEAR